MRPESYKQTVAMGTSQSNLDCEEGQGCCRKNRMCRIQLGERFCNVFLPLRFLAS